MDKIIISKEYYLDFLIKICKEKHYDKDFLILNESKLTLLNSYLGLDNLISFDFKKKSFELKELNNLNIHELKHINGFNKFDFKDKYQVKNITSYINMYFNIIINKLVSQEFLICSGIEYETNDVNEFVKNIMEVRVKDNVITSHRTQILNQYKLALNTLFNVLYGIDFTNIENVNSIKWGVEITNEFDLNIINKQLSEFDYF